MEFIPREKMSKKKRKELDEESRVVWAFSPFSRVIPNKKAYDSKKAKQEEMRDDDYQYPITDQ